MIPSRVIETKRDGGTVDAADLEAFLRGYLEERVPEYQMAAFLMAAYFRGLDAAEAEVLVRCMLGSGSVLDLPGLDGPKVDKHSTGGVGDKVSLALAPLAAEAGVYVPMMAGRGLGHTTGTLDKLRRSLGSGRPSRPTNSWTSCVGWGARWWGRATRSRPSTVACTPSGT